MNELSISALLAQLAQERPDTPAFTFVDYDINPDGLAETLTWAQLRTRVQALAAELARHGVPGDRAAIVPSVAGWARMTGYNTIFIDDRDPFAQGFVVK